MAAEAVAAASQSSVCHVNCLANAAFGSAGMSLLPRSTGLFMHPLVRFQGVSPPGDPALIPAHAGHVWRPPRTL